MLSWKFKTLFWTSYQCWRTCQRMLKGCSTHSISIMETRILIQIICCRQTWTFHKLEDNNKIQIKLPYFKLWIIYSLLLAPTLKWIRLHQWLKHFSQIKVRISIICRVLHNRTTSSFNHWSIRLQKIQGVVILFQIWIICSFKIKDKINHKIMFNKIKR